jgi:site-specific DNA recombinase
MTKVAIYARVSTVDKQDVTRQIEELEQIIVSKGIDKCDIEYYKEKKSGYKDDREELAKLLAKIQEDNNYYDCIFVHEISRLGRRTKKVRMVLDILEDSKVNLFIKNHNLYFLNDDGSKNQMGSLILSIIIELADAEAETFKQRSISGLLSSAKAGKAGGGKWLPYGFSKDENKLLIENKEEAEVIKTIFNLYKDGCGIKVISGTLNERNIKTRAHKSFGNDYVNKRTEKKGKDVKWSDKQIHDILKNPIYKGLKRYWGADRKDKETNKPNQEPLLIPLKSANPIISEELFDECTRIRTSKTHKNNTTKYVYLLKDLIKCGVCGRNYFAKFKPVKGGDKVYICSSRLIKGGNCGNTGINISLIESAIFNEIVDSDAILKHINSKDEIKGRLENIVEKTNLSIKQDKSLLAEKDKEIESLITMKEKGQITDERYSPRYEAHLNDFDNIQTRIQKNEVVLRQTKNALNQQTNLETTTKQLNQFKNNRMKLRIVFQQIVEKVVVNAINKDTVMANVYIQLDEVRLPTTLVLYLDIQGIRKPSKSFGYIPKISMPNQLVYNSNILETSKEEIQKELISIEENAGMIDVEYTPILQQNVLSIPITK